MKAVSSSFPQPTLSRRGIYWADYTLAGMPVMYAVSSRGEIVGLLGVPTGQEDIAALQIQRELDINDPRPPYAAARALPLRLVRPG